MWRCAVLVMVAGCSFGAPLGGAPAGDDVGDDGGPGVPPDADACAGPDGDGDGVGDACDACPMDNPNDSDGDGVCNSADACAAGDDGADADNDGVADACDDWPCGAKPSSPSSVVTWATTDENVTLSLIDVASQAQLAVVTAGSTFDVGAAYSIIDCQCPGCIDQIEIGVFGVGKQACLYNGNPNGNGNCTSPTVGVASRTITAPATPGVYELRFNRGNDTSCQNNGDWWANVAPGTGNTFALVCVK